MRIAWLAVVVLAACDGSATVHAPSPPPPEKVAVEPEPDVPDDTATRALADAACPRVAAPYFYRIEKAGKVSHVLGTRHMGVSAAKLPRSVLAPFETASLVVFETAPGDDVEDAAAEPARSRSSSGPSCGRSTAGSSGRPPISSSERRRAPRW